MSFSEAILCSEAYLIWHQWNPFWFNIFMIYFSSCLDHYIWWDFLIHSTNLGVFKISSAFISLLSSILRPFTHNVTLIHWRLSLLFQVFSFPMFSLGFVFPTFLWVKWFFWTSFWIHAQWVIFSLKYGWHPLH